MAYRVLITFVLLILTSGCVFARKISPLSMTDIYVQSMGEGQKDLAGFIEENLKEQKTFGYVKPYIPVIQPPLVQKIWIPDHKSRENDEVLIGGHWVYLMIQGPKWFTQGGE